MKISKNLPSYLGYKILRTIYVLLPNHYKTESAIDEKEVVMWKSLSTTLDKLLRGMRYQENKKGCSLAIFKSPEIRFKYTPVGTATLVLTTGLIEKVLKLYASRISSSMARDRGHFDASGSQTECFVQLDLLRYMNEVDLKAIEFNEVGYVTADLVNGWTPLSDRYQTCSWEHTVKNTYSSNAQYSEPYLYAPETTLAEINQL
tara:strand:+ start:1075 stop:1683 length:609 start_codon:yes stop_codon:yes gene_type:complete